MTGAKDIEIACEVRRETTLAVLIFDGTREVWVPKSHISDEAVDKSSIFIPEWLAIEKGLV
jgi:hypothetical protein